MKVLKNNYVPPQPKLVEKTVRRTVYQVQCPGCKSELEVEKSDLFYENYFGGKAYRCPCCGYSQAFGTGKVKKLVYEEKVFVEI